MVRWALLVAIIATATGSASASSTATRWFHSPSGNIDCEVGVSRPTLGTSAFCISKRPVRCATLKPSGKVVVYQNCLLGDAPESAFTLRYGHSVRVGPFQCSSRRDGMRCQAVRNGHGFLISRARLKRF